MSQLPLPGRRFIQPAQVTLDATGAGECSVTCPAGCRWEVELVTVSTTTSTTQPQAKLYLGTSSTGHFLEGTYSGHQDATNTLHRVAGGEALTVAWSGASANVRATMRVSGMQFEGG